MSILRGMYAGVSGLGAEADALGVVADNLANSGTTGFKQEDALFEDVLGRSMTEGGTGAGAGVRMSGVRQAFSQGSLANTGVSGDLALTGDGFFVVTGTVAGVVGDFYTRNGSFQVDARGTLMGPAGLALQGYAAAPAGGFASAVSDVKLPTNAIPARTTQNVSLTANLDAGALPPIPPWDPQDPAASSNFATSLAVYDSLGSSHDLQLAFRATAPGIFTWYALAAGAEVTAGVPGQNVVVGEGVLAFDTNGALQGSIVLTPISVDFVDASPAQAINVRFGSDIASGGTGLDGLTQFASPFNVSALSQDGYASGSAAGFSVDPQGVVLGLFTNGQSLAIAQLAIASFRSNEGLARAGQSVWLATRESGTAALGVAGSGSRGAVSQGALEQSNVDLADQFVDLISHQRAFQANSKVISTADDMLSELVALKR